MSGIKPLFTSAPRLRLTINGTPIAFAIGFSLNVGVNFVPVMEIGSYGPVALEPVSYAGVTGSIQIQKLISSPTKAARGVQDPTSNPSFNSSDAQVGSPVAGNNSILSIENLALHLDPEKVILSSTFDIDVYMKYTDSNDTTTKIKEFLYLQLKDCRLNARSAGIAAGSLVGEAVNFNGLLYIGSPNIAIPEKSDLGVVDGTGL